MAKRKPKKLSREALEKVADVFKAFSEPTRLQIIQELKDGHRSVSELVDDQVGRLCAVEDVDGLTQAVLDFIEQPDLREEKSRGALERSGEDRFDPESVHTRILESYESLIASHREK